VTVRGRATAGALAWPQGRLGPALARVGLSKRLLASTPVAARYGLLYALVSVVSFWPILLGYVPIPAEIITSSPLWSAFQVPFSQRYYGVMEDLVRSFYSGHRLIGEAIRSGEIPLWNPYVLNGYPMHAANAMAIFAPLTMVGYVLPIDAAWTFGMVARPAFAALGTALYARALGLGHGAALGAGLVFGWCGFQVGWAGQAMVDITVWTPWVLLGVLRVAERPTPARIGLTALALAMPPLGGHPEVAIYVMGLGAASALLYLARPPFAEGYAGRRQALGGLLAAGVLALMLAAIQILPTAEWIPQLKRELVGLSDPMSSGDILNFVVRHIAAAPTNVIGTHIPNGALYAGLVTLLVAPAALAHQRRREVWFFVLVLATALQFAFGWGPFVWLHHASPVPIDFPKTRIIVLADFALAMLAGFGVAILTSRARPVPRWVIPATALVVVAVAALLVRLPDAGPLVDDAADRLAGPRSLFQGTPFAIGLVVLTALALAWPLLKRGARTSPAVLCVLVALDMLTFAWGHVPFSKTDDLRATPPAIRFLQERVDASTRILATRNTIPYNWEAQYRLATPAGYLYITRLMVDVMTPITGGSDPGIVELRHDLLLRQRSPLIDFLGVKYLVAARGNNSAAEIAQYPDRFVPVFDDGSVQVFENPRALPLTHVVPCGGIEIQEFQRRAISRVNSPAFDHATMVILDEKIDCPVDRSSPAGSGAVGQPTELIGATFNTYTVRADAAVPSLLVYADTYYEGWRAFVDDREVPIVRANHAFKAVRVDPGQHVVRFVFDPWTFRWGAGITLAGLAIVAGLLGWPVLRRQRSQSPT